VVLRRMFGHKSRKKVAGGRRKLHNEELHNLYSPPNRVIKSRGGVGCVACIRS